MDLKLRCSSSGCPCSHFSTSKENLRVCDGCSHSWLAHLFEKLLRTDETLSIFDVCSLALYGTHALPIRLKIVIERLLSTLQPEETDKILQSFGWNAEDLARGYMIHDSEGCFLNKWSILPRDEEPLVLEQFLRFGPTHQLTFALLRKELSPPPPSLTPQSSTFTLSPKGAVGGGGGGGGSTIMTTPTGIDGHQGSFFPNNNNNNISSNNHHHSNSNSNSNSNVNNHSSSRLQRSPSSTNVRSPSKSSEHAGDNCGGSVLNLSTSGPSSAAESSIGSHSDVDGVEGEDDDDDVGIMVRDGEVVDDDENDGESMSNDNDEDGDRDGMSESGEHNDDGERREQESCGLGAGGAVDLSSNSKSTPASSPSPNSGEFLGVSGKSRDRDHESEVSTRSRMMSMNMRYDQKMEASKMNSLEMKLRHGHSGPGRKPKYAASLSSKQAWATAAIAASVTVNPATGKRRVLCSVCQKTFCDKGALKIHFSAVHLREMHKCTVNGCTMMFSSRRSRNRHSANPNPKLHSPHIRRKISPNDGRSGGSSRSSLSNHVPLNVHQHHGRSSHGHGGHGGGNKPASLLPGTNLLAPRFSPPSLSPFGPHLLPPSFNLGGSNSGGDLLSSSSSMDGNDERTTDDHHNPALLSAAVNELLRKNGARKRKSCNPIRVPSGMDLGVSEAASHQLLSNHVNQLLMLRGQMMGNGLRGESRERDREHKERVSPKQTGNESPSPNESRGSSPGDLFANNPLALLASKVFQFNPQFQNLPFNPAMTEKLYESFFAGKRGMELLMDKKSQNKLNNNLDDENGSMEHTAV